MLPVVEPPAVAERTDVGRRSSRRWTALVWVAALLALAAELCL